MIPDKVENVSAVDPFDKSDFVRDRYEEALELLDRGEAISENVVHLPIEHEVEMRIEAEVAKINMEARAKAFEKYLFREPVPKIAKDLGVDMHTVNCWARDGGWAARLRRMNDALEEVVQESIRAIRLAKAEGEAIDSLTLSKKIRDRVLQSLDEGGDISAQNLKALGEAAKTTVDLGNRGMGESQDSKSKDDNGKRPLVMVFDGGLPPIKHVDDAR